MSTQTAHSQKEMTPEKALTLLKEGNVRFQNNNQLNRNLSEQVAQTGGGQYPHSVVLHCIDSRVSAELLFDQGVGDVFSTRIAGNFVNEDILGSMEFACKLAGSKLVVVLGHTKCGAVKGACAGAELGNLTQMLAKLSPAVKQVEKETTKEASLEDSFVQAVSDANVKLTIERIKSESSVLKEMLDNKEIDIVGGMYSVDTGAVTFF